MSLAWTTVVVLVLLLPGFLFFVGLQSAERFSRDATANPLVQLAGIVLVAFFVHGFYFAVIDPLWCGPRWFRPPCINLDDFFRALLLESKKEDSLEAAKQAAKNLAEFRFHIFLYPLVTSWLALRAGLMWGRIIVQGRPKWFGRVRVALIRTWLERRADGLRRTGIQLFWKHKWTYDLTVENRDGNPLLVFVLTRIRHEHRVLIYRGFLREFFVASNGQISYLVLKGVSSYYLLLNDHSAVTSEREDWHRIGGGHRTSGSEPFLPFPDTEVELRDDKEGYMVIHGQDIENVIFDRMDITESEMETMRTILDPDTPQRPASPEDCLSP